MRCDTSKSAILMATVRVEGSTLGENSLTVPRVLTVESDRREIINGDAYIEIGLKQEALRNLKLDIAPIISSNAATAYAD